jgi:large subunit ribosomal protein L18
MNKKIARIRRATKARQKMRELGAVRLSVHRTPQHIYAQLISPMGAEVLAAASTLDEEARKEVSFGGNIKAAILRPRP